MTRSSERADYLTRRRARVLPVLAILLMTQQGAFVTGWDGSTPDRLKVAAWLIMSITLLVLLATGGGWAHSREVRALLNDETTRAHRAQALSLGFLNTMATGIVLYVVSLYKAVPGSSVVHVMMTVGIGSALIAFAALERRALRG